MNIRSSAGTLATLATALLLAVSAQAATYTTQITGTTAGAFSYSRIEVLWSTSINAGDAVTTTDLSDLSFSVYDGGNALVYTDHAIVAGVSQPIGGVARSLSDIVFDAVSGTSIGSFDNDFNQLQLDDGSGVSFNLYGDTSGVINLAYYLNGELQDDTTFTVTGQSTTTPIPEPATCAGLAGLLGLGFAAFRRRRA